MMPLRWLGEPCGGSLHHIKSQRPAVAAFFITPCGSEQAQAQGVMKKVTTLSRVTFYFWWVEDGVRTHDLLNHNQAL